MSTVKKDVVRTILPETPGKPIGVLFQFHAAVYFLDRDHPHFDEWLAMLRESQRDGVSIEFTYAVEGQKLTHVALVR